MPGEEHFQFEIPDYARVETDSAVGFNPDGSTLLYRH